MEFNLKSLPNYTFRVAKISPVSLLSLRTVLDFDNIKQCESTYNFILEHIEVQIGNVWLKVKTEKTDLFTPADLETNFIALEELCSWFIVNYLGPLFTKSKESSQTQQ